VVHPDRQLVSAEVARQRRFRLIDDARTLDAERTAVAVDIAAGISFVVAGVLALRFVRAVTEREAERAAAEHGAEADAERVRTAREGRGRRRVATVAVTLVGAAALVVSVAVAAGSLSSSDRDASGDVSERTAVSVFERLPGHGGRRLRGRATLRRHAGGGRASAAERPGPLLPSPHAAELDAGGPGDHLHRDVRGADARHAQRAPSPMTACSASPADA
jgi:hypothetical protein